EEGREVTKPLLGCNRWGRACDGFDCDDGMADVVVCEQVVKRGEDRRLAGARRPDDHNCEHERSLTRADRRSRLDPRGGTRAPASRQPRARDEDTDPIATTWRLCG